MYFEIIWLTILQLFDREAGNTHRVLNFKILTENTLMSNQQSTSATVIPFLEQFHFFSSVIHVPICQIERDCWSRFHFGFEIELPLVSKPTVELRLAIHKYHLGIYYYLSIIWIPKNINHNISKKWKFRENVDIGIRYILLRYYQGHQISHSTVTMVMVVFFASKSCL